MGSTLGALLTSALESLRLSWIQMSPSSTCRKDLALVPNDATMRATVLTYLSPAASCSCDAMVRNRPHRLRRK